MLKLLKHDIWAMQVYITQLEYKGDKIRGVFNYKIEDHFGLDINDINHPDEGRPYELLEGFRSWYILQHYKGYNYKTFTTKIDFELT